MLRVYEKDGVGVQWLRLVCTVVVTPLCNVLGNLRTLTHSGRVVDTRSPYGMRISYDTATSRMHALCSFRCADSHV